MIEVKALFPIGKTQWAKWRTEQRIAFNEARESGVPFPEAVKYVNELELVEINIAPEPDKKLKVTDIFHVVEDVVEAVVEATPLVAAAKTVVKATRGKKKAK